MTDPATPRPAPSATDAPPVSQDAPTLLESAPRASSDAPTLVEQSPPVATDAPTQWEHAPDLGAGAAATIASRPDDSATSTRSGAVLAPVSAPGDRKTLGPYEILEELGAGGMGVVYLARQRGLDRLVALKVLKQQGEVDPDRVRRFLREARAAARLSHPGIVPVYDIGESGDACYYSMEYVLGQSLNDQAKAGTIKPRRALEIVATVARALAYAHAEGVIHRDIKPANIMMTTDGRPLLMDFGIARDLSNRSVLTQEGVSLGTPAFMPPEQAVGNLTAVDGRSDVYSLGGVLYQLLTGRPPFVGDQPFQVIVKVLSRPPEPVRKFSPHVHVDIETICLKCLEKEPVRRYDSAEALAEDIERFLGGAPILARPVSRIEQFARTARRLWAHSLGVAALVLIVATVLIRQEVQALDAAEANSRERERLGQTTRRFQVALHRWNEAGRLAPDQVSALLAETRRQLDAVVLEQPGYREARLQRAELAARVHDFMPARADLAEILRVDPLDAPALYAGARLGDAIRDIEESAGALAVLEFSEQCRRRLCEQTDSPLAAHAEVRRLLRDGQVASAVTAADALVARTSPADPGDAAWLQLLAHARAGDLPVDDWLRRCDEVLQVRAHDPAVWRLRAGLLDDAGRDEAAARALETCLRLLPRPPALDLRRLALMYKSLYPQPNHPEHARLLERLTTQAPSDPYAWMWLARFHAAGGHGPESEAALARALPLAAHPVQVLAWTWEIHRTSRGAAEANAWLDGQLQDQPIESLVEQCGAKSVQELLEALTDAGELTRIETLLSAVVRRLPDDPDVLECLADLWFEMRRDEEAVGALDRVIAVRPHDAGLYSRRGRAYRRLRKYAEALADLERAVALHGMNLRDRLHYGMMLMVHRRVDDAAAQFAFVLMQTPTLELEHKLHRWAVGDFEKTDAPAEAAPPKVDAEKLLAGSLVRNLLAPIARHLLRQGMKALDAGDRLLSERAFAAACIALPKAPEPHVCFARWHAQQQSWLPATVALERAAALGYDKLARIPEDRYLRALLAFPRVRSLVDGTGVGTPDDGGK